MSAIPPNNLDQLIAWVRVFTEEFSTQFTELEKQVQTLSKQLKKEKP